MFAAGLITFRETLEAALVVGILLSFLYKTHQPLLKKYVWLGVFFGVGFSIILSILLKVFFGGLSGTSEQLFEGILMFVTAGFLTWMILWVHRQKGMAKKIEEKAAYHIATGFPLGLTLLTFTSVMREGVETALYLQAVSSLGGGNQLLGAGVGIVIALAIGYGIFRFSVRMNLIRLLKISGAVLLLFAAGLVAHGVHEFQEIGLLPIFSFDPMINISHILDNNSFIGSLLRTLFGYTAKPTMLELFAYSIYIFIIFSLEQITDRLLLAKQIKPRVS